MPSITPVPRGSNLHLKRTELYTERLLLNTTQPSAGLLAGTMDELLAALLSLWQRCPHGFPLAISLPSPFSWTLEALAEVSAFDSIRGHLDKLLRGCAAS